MTTLLLVRHASTASTGRRLGGWTPGVDLSAKGLAEAAAVGDRLAPLPIAAVYASPLKRTRQTAAAIAGHHGLDVAIRRGIGEVDYGEWTDQPLGALRRRRLWRAIQATPSRVAFPGGESIRAAQARAVDVSESLAAEHDGAAIVCVSHADVIKAVVAHHLAMPLDAFQRLVISPASVSVLDLPAGGHPVLRRLNDTGPISADEVSRPGADGRGRTARRADGDTAREGTT